MRFRDKDVWVEEGEMIIVPSKIEHQPVAQEEIYVILFEPKLDRVASLRMCHIRGVMLFQELFALGISQGGSGFAPGTTY